MLFTYVFIKLSVCIVLCKVVNCLKRRLIGNLFYIITFQYEWDVDFNCNVNIFSHNSYQLKAGVSFINQHILFRRQMTMGLIMSNSFFIEYKNSENNSENIYKDYIYPTTYNI